MDSQIGIVGEDFVMLCSDMAQIRSIVVLKSDEDKILELDTHKMMSMAGPNGDRVSFGEYIKKNLLLYQFRSEATLSTHAAANFTRKQLHDGLRSDPSQVNILFAGWDSEVGPSLYYMDYLASMSAVPFAAHGYAAFFVSGLLDKLCKDKMSLEQVSNVMKACIAELSKRFLVNAENFVVKIVDKDGVRLYNLFADNN